EDAIASCAFRTIERCVGVSHQYLQRVTRNAGGSDTETCGYGEFAAVVGFHHGDAQLLGSLAGFGKSATWQQNSELFAADARKYVVRSQPRLHRSHRAL